MFGLFSKNKVKEKTIKDYEFSVTKITTFGHVDRFFPLVKEEGVFGGWNTLFEVNRGSVVAVPGTTTDPDYSWETIDLAHDCIGKYKAQLQNKFRNETQREEHITYKEEKVQKYENEK